MPCQPLALRSLQITPVIEPVGVRTPVAQSEALLVKRPSPKRAVLTVAVLVIVSVTALGACARKVTLTPRVWPGYSGPTLSHVSMPAGVVLSTGGSAEIKVNFDVLNVSVNGRVVIVVEAAYGQFVFDVIRKPIASRLNVAPSPPPDLTALISRSRSPVMSAQAQLRTFVTFQLSRPCAPAPGA